MIVMGRAWGTFDVTVPTITAKFPSRKRRFHPRRVKTGVIVPIDVAPLFAWNRTTAALAETAGPGVYDFRLALAAPVNSRQRGQAPEGIGAGERRAEEDVRGLAAEEPRVGGAERKVIVSPTHEQRMTPCIIVVRGRTRHHQATLTRNRTGRCRGSSRRSRPPTCRGGCTRLENLSYYRSTSCNCGLTFDHAFGWAAAVGCIRAKSSADFQGVLRDLTKNLCRGRISGGAGRN